MIYENVKVPKKHLIGKLNRGFIAIMKNFNHERLTLAVSSNRYSRICISESIKYARKRKTFGKRLIDHQVIRHKIANMVRKVESTHAQLENIFYQIKCGANDKELGSSIALIKVFATKTFEYCAREASVNFFLF